MYRRFHDRFGTAGVLVAVIALVLALGGSALAASGALTGKQRKEVEKIAKKYAGKPGEKGPKGDAGASGANGKDGTNGTNGKDGTNGTNGKSVVTGAVTPGPSCEEGGAFVEVEGQPASKKNVCNGKEGSPWTAGGALPSGKTETGSWGTILKEGESDTIAFSFTLPIEPAVAPHYVPTGTTAECPGVVAGVPKAEPGHLCVYAGSGEAGALTIEGFLTPLEFNLGAGPTGSLLLVKCTSPQCIRFGPWAATAA